MAGTTPVLFARSFSFFLFVQVIYSSVRIVQLTGEIYGLIIMCSYFNRSSALDQTLICVKCGKRHLDPKPFDKSNMRQ